MDLFLSLAKNDKGEMLFTQDQAFSSPSAAAVIVSGRPANGRTVWFESQTRKTYGDWQSEQLE